MGQTYMSRGGVFIHIKKEVWTTYTYYVRDTQYFKLERMGKSFYLVQVRFDL